MASKESGNNIPENSKLQEHDFGATEQDADVSDGYDRSLRFGSLTFTHNTYKMDHPRRGTALIFNHFYFLTGNARRKGTGSDVKNLMRALLKLGFTEKDIYVYEDLNAAEISHKLREVQKKDHNDCDMLMVFVLTHGKDNDKIFAFDVEYPTETLWEPFRADVCKSLAGKPKLFFVVACRGENVDQGETLTIPGCEPITEVDAKPVGYNCSYSIPVWSDFLFVYSTYKGYYSYRNVEDGTWYIQAFCEELSNTNLSEVSFLDFLTAVNERLSTTFGVEALVRRMKQISTFSSTLTKRLYFRKSTAV